MKLPFSEPSQNGSSRAKAAKKFRDLATEVARLRPQAKTSSNLEEQDFGPSSPQESGYPTNFTKGLLHNPHTGLVDDATDYRKFVEAINSEDRSLFENHVLSAEDRMAESNSSFNCPKTEKGETQWRGWESPRAGHTYELQGPDAGAVGMAPAPRLAGKSNEVGFEMAEVYSLALLRDVPFERIEAGDNTCINGGHATITPTKVVSALNGMHYVSGNVKLDRFERNRRDARLDCEGKISLETLFRGSTEGAKKGHYISQFLLVGNNSIAGNTISKSCDSSAFSNQNGYIGYGSLTIDQRTITHLNGLDYMTDWSSWMDVQNGANFKGLDKYESKKRFITTPRDLATYVHFDALYEAYLNAGLILLGNGVPFSKGFPEPSPSGKRDSFATFGGPHILSLVTEVATRCLKGVRRQKFNYHRRARPEVMGARYTVSQLGGTKDLGCAGDAFKDSLHGIDKHLLKAVIEHNNQQKAKAKDSKVTVKNDILPSLHGKKITDSSFDKANLLLPMAFPEGSPMHPAYGAGHATVAGGCVTMLKAFFEMYEDCDSKAERTLDFAFRPDIAPTEKGVEPGETLTRDEQFEGKLTIQGELDKLAANISIGRNMAGVHYYSDYYDSLRMGERIAVGILIEQAPTYDDQMEVSFTSFDGDYITISGQAGSCPSLSILDKCGEPISNDDWWLRHVVGSEFIEDF